MHIEKSNEYISVYKQYRNILNCALRATKRNHYHSKLKEIEGSPEQMWQGTKSVFGDPQDFKSYFNKDEEYNLLVNLAKTSEILCE